MMYLRATGAPWRTTSSKRTSPIPTKADVITEAVIEALKQPRRGASDEEYRLL
jgi:hypothetical protein